MPHVRTSSVAHERQEARTRRQLRLMGLALRKSRYRHPELLALCSGYMIVDPFDNVIVAGAHPRAFGLSLADVEEDIAERRACH